MPPPVPPKREAGPDDGGQADLGKRGAGFLDRVGDGAARAFDADLRHRVAEFQPVLGAVDDVGLGADQLDAVALQRADCRQASSRC